MRADRQDAARQDQDERGPADQASDRSGERESTTTGSGAAPAEAPTKGDAEGDADGDEGTDGGDADRSTRSSGPGGLRQRPGS